MSQTTRWVLLFALGAVSWATAAHATGSSEEGRLRAAFLYRLVDFVSWPDRRFEHPTQPIRFCLYGQIDPTLRSELERAANRRPAQLRPLTIHDHARAPRCDLVYLSGEDSTLAGSDRGTVVVVDAVSQLERQGHLALALEVGREGRGRLIFRGDRQRLAAAEFNLSSKLLALVRFDG